MSETPATPLQRLCRGGLNLLIAGLLALLLLDGLPLTPEPVRGLVEPLTRRLGIWQGPWALFAPQPDGQNHRYRAEITYADGRRIEWQSPTWQDLSPAERFRTHRLSEYLDHVWGVANEPGWDAWARHLAQTERPEATHDQRPCEVRVIIEIAAVQQPDEKAWPPTETPRVYDDRWVLFTKKFP